MTTAYTPILGLALPVTGELQGTWGQTVNDEITSLTEAAIAGTTLLTSDVDVTLSTTDGSANQARQIILRCTGARSSLKTIVAPARSKVYFVINATSGGFGVKIAGPGPTTGVTVAPGKSTWVAWNGSDFVEIAPAVATNLSAGTTGAIPYQTAANVTAFLGIGTAGQVLQVNPGATAPEWGAVSGTGNVARVTSPSFTTPSLGAATALSINSLTITTSTGTLTIANGKTVTVNNTVTLNGTDGTTMTFPSATTTLVGTDSTQTLTNKRYTPRIGTISSASTITPTADTADQYNVTALATNPTIAAPSGTPTDGQKLILRILDNGTSRTLTWTTSSGGYRAVAAALPPATSPNLVLYVGCIWNAAANYWDVIAIIQE